MMPQYRNEKFVLKKYCAPRPTTMPPVTVRASMMVLNTLKSECLQIDFIDVHTILLGKQRYRCR